MQILIAKGFLFDMDGTLLDSHAKVEVVWRQWCERCGIDLAAVMAIQQGVRTEDTIAKIAPQLDAAFEAAWVDQLESADCEGIVPIAGSAVLLRTIPQDRWTIATSATMPVASMRLHHCHLPVPASMVTAECVSAGKPDPQIYRLAASRLGLDPADCIAFEDAPAGIHSALAAGCRVVQIGGTQALHPDVVAHWQDFAAVRFAQHEGVLTLSF
ncbi:HAD-IA family hydrolase [Chitinibacter sp. S2-10]|uniref:HAD-IA family hydrolase n=1 Tax=Chitinibacter sp. S2-10 TaxID=3373597 RepID=UPI0039777A48